MRGPVVGLLTRAGAGTPVAAAGLSVFLVGGVLTAFIAATALGPVDYTVYAAYSSLIGVLVLGPSSSLEQESALRASLSRETNRSLLVGMSMRASAVWFLAALVIAIPAGGWQTRLLGSSTATVIGLVLLGTPVVFAAAIGRGVLAAHRSYRAVGAANASTGLFLLCLPPALHLAGFSWLRGFLGGTVLAWLPALAIVALRMSPATRCPLRDQTPDASPRHHVTALLLAGNMLMLGTLLAVPVVLRWHVHDLGAHLVADAQLLVSLSRLSTTAVLGFLPLTVARLSFGVAASGNRAVLPWLSGALTLGGAAVIGLAALGDLLVAGLTGRSSDIGLVANLLTSLPVMFLCPAIVAMALSIVRQRWGLIVIAWSSGLTALVVVAGLDPHGSIVTVALEIAVASSLPAVCFLIGLTSPWGRRAAASPLGRSHTSP